MYLGIIVVVVGMIVLATQVNPDNQPIKQDASNARKMIGTILDNGAKAVFDQGLSAPTTEFIYKETEKIIVSSLSDLQLRELINQVPDGEYRDYVLSLVPEEQKALFDRIQNQETLNSQEQQILDAMNKQISEYSATNQTEIVIEEIQVSELELTSADRQTGIIKKCRVGNQCDISGNFLIIDNAGEPINPPYNYFLSLDCEKLEWCNLNPIGINEITNPDGTWTYTTTLNPAKYIPGNYDVFVRATIMKDDMSYWIEGSGIVEVIP